MALEQIAESRLSKYEFVRAGPGELVRVPTFLSGDFGRDFFKEYQARVKADYSDASYPSLEAPFRVLKRRKGIVIGSNVYAVVLANQILREVGLRTATPADVERTIKSEELNLSRVYIDTGLILRRYPGNKNRDLVEHLTKQLSDRCHEPPVMIPLASLDLRRYAYSSSLTLDLREDAEVIPCDIPCQPAGFNSRDIDEKTGLPKEYRRGDRNIFPRGSGLLRLRHEKYSIIADHCRLDSSCDKPNNLDSQGRIVAVKDD
ncbi:hypothetical protein GOV06_01645 [Candidatus Woesearchaeota archaeon]|nr:hypothetical protein [Candidatus Woesearchaeota archaeon]